MKDIIDEASHINELKPCVRNTKSLVTLDDGSMNIRWVELHSPIDIKPKMDVS